MLDVGVIERGQWQIPNSIGSPTFSDGRLRHVLMLRKSLPQCSALPARSSRALATDHLRLGMAAAIGGLALGGPAHGVTLRQRAFALGAALLAGCAAISTGTTIANHGSLIVVAVPAVAAIAGFFGGISLAMARETTRFILFTTIAAGLSAPEVRPFGMTLLFFLGGTWTLGLSLLLHAVFGRAKRAAESSAAACGRRRALSRCCSDDGGSHSFACQAGNIRFESGRV